MKKILLGLAISLLIGTSANAAEFNVNLKYGSKGSDVKKLQEFLAEQDLYTGPITGNFFSLTLKAVKDFQRRELIAPVSGFFGSLTRAKVNTILDTQLADSENESVSDPVVVEAAPVSAEVLRLNELLGAVQNQNVLLQNSLDLQKSEADRLRAAEEAEKARLAAIEQARVDAENLARQRAEAEARKPLFTSEQILDKFSGGTDRRNALLSIATTESTVSFGQNGHYWGNFLGQDFINTRIVFDGHTVLTKDGGSSMLENGEWYDCLSSYCAYAPGMVRKLSQGITYTYQIIVPTEGRENSVYEGKFYLSGESGNPRDWQIRTVNR